MKRENPVSVWRLVFFMCFVYFHLLSKSLGEDVKTKESMIDKIKVCPTVYVIGNSSYINNTCNGLPYPTTFTKSDPNLVLCMIVFDTTSKICEYSSKIPVVSSETNLLPETVQKLDSEIAKFELVNDNPDICKNISSIFNKLNHSKIEGVNNINPYIDFAQNTMLIKKQCNYTCHNFENSKINHLCTYLLWANTLFNSLKPIKVENVQGVNLNTKESHPIEEPVAQENLSKNKKQNTEVINKKIESKKTDNNINRVNESEDQQNKQKLPETNKKVDDNKQIHTADPVNEPKNIPNVEKNLENSNNHNSIPAPPREEDTADLRGSKKNEGEVDVPHRLPQDDTNLDADSAEDPQNKKENEDPEEGNDRENADNDQKELNNQDAEVPVKNPDENKFQNGQKFIPHSLTLKGDEESHFFTYFSVISLFCIVLYIGYHNKQKIFAILLEGRRSRRGRGSRRRPSTASYRKLDCNLEEAVTSQCNSNVTHVIY